MQHYTRWMIVVLIIAGLQMSACDRKASTYKKIEPAHVEHIEGSKLSKVTLTEKAVERIDLKTGPVKEQQIAGSMRKVIPYSALLYDNYGKTWLYKSTAPRTYVRHQISVDYIEGDLAILSDGPPAGTEIVTLAAAELLGAEIGIGH